MNSGLTSAFMIPAVNIPAQNKLKNKTKNNLFI
jgi:hypothetical protein